MYVPVSGFGFTRGGDGLFDEETWAWFFFSKFFLKKRGFGPWVCTRPFAKERVQKAQSKTHIHSTHVSLVVELV
jgi:hypothetical protein